MGLSNEQEQNKSLIPKIILRYIFSFVLLSLIIFIPAGRLDFWNGWFFLGIFNIPSILIMLYLYSYDKELLIKRMNMKEKEKPQKIVLLISFIAYPATFIVSGLDDRFGWSALPLPLVLFAGLIFISGILIFFFVMRQNSYASRVVEIQEGQKIIEDGLYGIVRHPMYTGAIIMFLALPLILDSFYGLIPAILIPFMLIIRIFNEEKVLSEGLPGYTEYMEKVRYRLIPYIW